MDTIDMLYIKKKHRKPGLEELIDKFFPFDYMGVYHITECYRYDPIRLHYTWIYDENRVIFGSIQHNKRIIFEWVSNISNYNNKKNFETLIRLAKRNNYRFIPFHQ